MIVCLLQQVRMKRKQRKGFRNAFLCTHFVHGFAGFCFFGMTLQLEPIVGVEEGQSGFREPIPQNQK